MIHGLMWFPLLGVFIALAYAGWNEYQRLEAYKAWAVDFERAKFDVKAILGQRGRELTWGKPTRQGPADLQTVAFDDIEQLRVSLDGELIDPMAIPPEELENNPYPGKKDIAITLVLTSTDSPATIPFTDSVLAIRWGQALINLIDPESTIQNPTAARI